MNIDPVAIKGKITALAPSFELMSEMTGKQSTASMMGFYAEHFVREGLAMHDVNIAVEQMMRAWQKSFWPSPEAIAIEAREVKRQGEVRNASPLNIQAQVDEACRVNDERKWESRLRRANDWRIANPVRFVALVKGLDTDIAALMKAIARMTDVPKFDTVPRYRQSFREGAGVGMCLAEEARMYMREMRRLDGQHRERARENMVADMVAA